MLDRWNEYSKCANKPLTDLIELNMEAFDNYISNLKIFNESTQAKNPTDFIIAQTKLINNANIAALKYAPDVNKIWFETSFQISKLYTDDLRNSLSKVSDLVKSSLDVSNK